MSCRDFLVAQISSCLLLIIAVVIHAFFGATTFCGSNRSQVWDQVVHLEFALYCNYVPVHICLKVVVSRCHIGSKGRQKSG